MLAIVVCAMALSVAVPLRTYWSQRAEMADQQERRSALTEEVRDLEQRKRELSDPAHVETEARERLGYVRPGETPYMVHVPPDPEQSPGQQDPDAQDGAWYERLWRSLGGD